MYKLCKHVCISKFISITGGSGPQTKARYNCSLKRPGTGLIYNIQPTCKPGKLAVFWIRHTEHPCLTPKPFPRERKIHQTFHLFHFSERDKEHPAIQKNLPGVRLFHLAPPSHSNQVGTASRSAPSGDPSDRPTPISPRHACINRLPPAAWGVDVTNLPGSVARPSSSAWNENNAPNKSEKDCYNVQTISRSRYGTLELDPDLS